MKKLFVIVGLASMTLLMSCAASVRTPKTSTTIKVGSIEQVHPDHARNDVKI